jgi:hypothetical protein
MAMDLTIMEEMIIEIEIGTIGTDLIMIDPDRDWNKKDRDNWNNYYKSYEGKWHNHTTGEKIIVDLTRRNLRIKFAGENGLKL